MKTPWKTIRDGRGTTYVHPLPEGVTVRVAYDPIIATHVCRWFNHTTRDWVVSYSDAEGRQVGASTYCGYAGWALENAAELIAEAATYND